MVKNLKGGKYAKRQKNGGAKAPPPEEPAPEEGQCHGIITRMLGNCRVSILLETGEEVQGKIRGALRKRVFMRPGDLVCACSREGLSEAGASVVDIVSKYTEHYIARLRRREPGLPLWKHAAINHGEEHEDEDGLVAFQEEEEEEGTDEGGGSEGEDSDEEEIDIDAI